MPSKKFLVVPCPLCDFDDSTCARCQGKGELGWREISPEDIRYFIASHPYAAAKLKARYGIFGIFDPSTVAAKTQLPTKKHISEHIAHLTHLGIDFRDLGGGFLVFETRHAARAAAEAFERMVSKKQTGRDEYAPPAPERPKARPRKKPPIASVTCPECFDYGHACYRCDGTGKIDRANLSNIDILKILDRLGPSAEHAMEKYYSLFVHRLNLRPLDRDSALVHIDEKHIPYTHIGGQWIAFPSAFDRAAGVSAIEEWFVSRPRPQSRHWTPPPQTPPPYTHPPRQTSAPASLRQQALDTLGITWPTTPDELKKAYRSAAFRNHPDRGGSHATMVAVNNAYDMLKSYMPRTNGRRRRATRGH